ncbi:MAG: hypothetical protein OXR05_00120 [Gemmatimonadota bacterium]|nr:hypothetical protein [Gemmatimonadota bacterium]
MVRSKGFDSDLPDEAMMQKWLRSDGWLAGGVGGVVAVPLAIVLHELGHFGAFVAFGLPDPVLRYASVSWAHSGEWVALFRAGDMAAAAALAEPWKMAVTMAAGPAVSYLTAIVCVFAVRRFGPGPLSLVLGLGLSAPGQGLGALMVLAINLFGGGFIGSQDEAWVASIAGISSSLTALPGVVCVVLAPWFLVTAIPRGRRVRVVVPVAGGMVLGLFGWLGWLGPLLLP